MLPPKLWHGSVVASKFSKPQRQRERETERETERGRERERRDTRVNADSLLCPIEVVCALEFIILPLVGLPCPRIEVANINLKAFKAHTRLHNPLKLTTRY